MRFCLFEWAPRTATGGRPAPARLGLLAGQWVVDVHAACLASLVGHMAPRRAAEIAEALCPSDLQLFLENGRHGRTALEDSLARLGDGLLAPDLSTPAGDRVVHPLDSVRFVPVVPWDLRYTPGKAGEWRAVEMPVPEGAPPAVFHTDSRPFLPEYLAVIGRAGADIPAEDALAHVAMVAECLPSDTVDAGIFLTLDEFEDDDDVRPALSEAVSEASASALLHVGDVVRTGRPPLGSLRETRRRNPEAPAGA